PFRNIEYRTSQEEGLAPADGWIGRAGASPSSLSIARIYLNAKFFLYKCHVHVAGIIANF
ncbi:MAG TPA: hypothetical protein VJ784_10555, partial [Pyrinomonadaceae bacterium]|nr:hypothetical protein [Pyrinomonadaceae bacterium]